MERSEAGTDLAAEKGLETKTAVVSDAWQLSEGEVQISTLGGTCPHLL